MSRLILALIVLSLAAEAQAQSKPWSTEYKQILREASVRRRAEIQRRNNAQQQAIDMLFGPNGIPALTRASDPWNAYGGYGRGGGFRGGYGGVFGGYGGRGYGYGGTPTYNNYGNPYIANSPYGSGFNSSVRSPSFPHRNSYGSGFYGTNYNPQQMNYYGTNSAYGPGFNPSIRSPSFPHRNSYGSGFYGR